MLNSGVMAPMLYFLVMGTIQDEDILIIMMIKMIKNRWLK